MVGLDPGVVVPVVWSVGVCWEFDSSVVSDGEVAVVEAGGEVGYPLVDGGRFGG